MKIKQFAVGGSVSYTPFIPNYWSGTVNADQIDTNPDIENKNKSNKKSPEKAIEGIQKEIFDILKERGIPSDVDEFLRYSRAYLDSATNAYEESIFNPDHNWIDISQLQSLANRVKFNKEKWDNTKERLNQKNTWGEVAITDGGLLYVVNSKTNELSRIDPKKYSENRNKYHLLSNSNLLAMRENDPNLAFNTEIFHDLNSSVSIKDVYDHLRKVTSELGEEAIQGYTEKDAKDIFVTAHELMRSGPNTYYHITDKKQISDLNKTLNYLYTQLDGNMKNRLTATVVAEGGNPNSSQDMYKMLFEIATEHSKTELSAIPIKDWMEEKGKKSSGGSGGKSESTTESTLAIEVAAGHLTPTTAYISPNAERTSDKSQMAFEAWNAGMPIDRQGDRILEGTLKQVLPLMEQAKGADISAVTFGNQLLTREQLGMVTWDGTSLMKRVALPKKEDHGQIVPDFDLLMTLNDLNAQLKANPSKSAINLELNKLADKVKNIPGVIFDKESKTFTIKPEKMGIFLSISGYGSESLMNIEEKSKPFLKELNWNEGALVTDKFDNLVRYGSNKDIDKDRELINVPSSKRWSMYYGNFYFPIVDPIQANVLTKKQHYPKDKFVYASDKLRLEEEIKERNKGPHVWEKTTL